METVENMRIAIGMGFSERIPCRSMLYPQRYVKANARKHVLGCGDQGHEARTTINGHLEACHTRLV